MVRVVRIPNSLHVGRIMLSEAYYDAVASGKYAGLEAEEEPQSLKFDAEGNLATLI